MHREEELKKLSTIFQALEEEQRLKIINQLKNEELCACELMEELSINQSTLSHHMKILFRENLILKRKEGKWVYYSLNLDTFKFLEKFFFDIKENYQNSLSLERQNSRKEMCSL